MFSGVSKQTVSQLAKELEEFGLSKFLRDNMFELCNRTLNPGKIAIILGADLEQISSIMNPADHFSRSQLLYQLILQTNTSAFDFLNALLKTINDHVVEFIQFHLPSSPKNRTPSNIHIDDAVSTPKAVQRIRFNLRDPVESFCGRADFLQHLHRAIQGASQHDEHKSLGVKVISQIKIISGLGGIGKTEASRMYILQYDNIYDNIIWINAESSSTSTDCFLELAKKIQIPSKTRDGKLIPLDHLLETIYARLCADNQKTLVVFDNVDEYEGAETTSGIKRFLPSYLSSELRKCPPVFLFTSRLRAWSPTMSNIEILELGPLTMEETMEFIVIQLNLDLDSDGGDKVRSTRKEVKDLAECIVGLPLALQQAVAYIKQQIKTSRILGTCYRISNFIEEFKKGMQKPRNLFLNSSKTWELTLAKINKTDSGETALKLIHFLAFLYFDNIPVDLLLQLVPHIETTTVAKGLALLDKFSLINLRTPSHPSDKETNQSFVTIHRQLQFFILQNLQERQEIQENVSALLRRFAIVIEYTVPAKCNDIYLNILQLLSNPLNLIEENDEFLSFTSIFCKSLKDAGRFEQALVLSQKLYQGWLKSRGERDEKTLGAENQMASILYHQGHLDQALKISQNVWNKEGIHLSPDHPNTIETKLNIASVLREQQKYDDSLKMLLEVLQQQVKTFGENNFTTVPTQNDIGLVYSQIGKYDKAMEMYVKAESTCANLLTQSYYEKLTIQHNKAVLHLKIGDVSNAMEFLKQVYEEAKMVLGEHHPLTLRALFWTAVGLEKEERKGVALSLYRDVHEKQNRSLGENHPKTVETREKIDKLLQIIDIKP